MIEKNNIIGLCSDHAGYDLKEFVKKWLEERDYKYVDFGTNSTESCDYPDYAHPMAEAVENKKCQFGISICGSGNGISITVNKHQGIRAALCWLPELAALARQHNDANVLSMPARFISNDEAEKILEAFFNSDFEGGRHQKRVDKISVK